MLRARVTDGDDDDSTVKLRPLPPRKVPPRWKKDGGRVELDVVGKKQVPSAKLDGEPERGEIEQVEHGALKLSKLFTEAQEAIVARATSGTALNDLAVLGPVDARKWDLPPEYFPHKLSVEEWSLPDGTRFVELSFKVAPGEARARSRRSTRCSIAWRSATRATRTRRPPRCSSSSPSGCAAPDTMPGHDRGPGLAR